MPMTRCLLLLSACPTRALAGNREFELILPPPSDDTAFARVVTAVALCLAPALGVIAQGIILDHQGPVLFRRTRTGLNGQPFQVWKHRTLPVQKTGPVTLAGPRAAACSVSAAHSSFAFTNIPKMFVRALQLTSCSQYYSRC